MSYRGISKALGIYFLFFSLLLTIPLILSYYYEFHLDPQLHPQPHSSLAFLQSILICLAFGLISYLIGYQRELHLYPKENIVFILLICLLTPALSSLPFLFSDTLSNPLQAYFESMSGFTTTGATVLYPKQYDSGGNEVPIVSKYGNAVPITNQFYGTVSPVRDPVTQQILYEGIEAVSKGVLFWRSLTQWIGGFGIVVLFIAILPPLGVGGVSGKLLFRMEIAQPLKESFLQRIVQVAFQLFLIYLGLTALQTVLLLMTNDEIDLFNAVTIAFSTISTGGFSIHNANIGYYQNAQTEWIIMLFMVMGSTNFIIYYYVLKGQFYRVFQVEFFVYLFLILLGSCLVSWYLIGTETMAISEPQKGALFSFQEAIRYGFFQMISAFSSTGFRTAYYDKWPLFVQTLMMFAIFIGGMSYSTAGGMKIIRQYILFREAQMRTESLFRSGGMRQFRIGGQEISSDTLLMIFTFFWIAICVVALSNCLFVLDNMDIQSAFSFTASILNNAGLGFRITGPTESCAFLSNFGLIFSSFLMLLGRLEYFIVLAVLTPAFWRE